VAGIVVTPERLDVENAHLNDLSSQLTLAQSQQADATSRDKSSKGNIAASPDVMQNPVVQQLKTQVAIQEAKVQNLGTQLGPRHPAYMQAAQELADLRRSLAAETGQVGNSLQQANQIGSARVAQLQADTEAQRQRIIDLSQKRDQLSVLQREVDNDQKAYDLVMQRSSETGIESQVAQSDTALLTSAYEPVHPSFPKIKLFVVLTLILGLLLGIGIALFIEILNPVVHSPLDIIEQLALPVFAVVPYGAIPGRKHGRTALLGGTRKLLPAS
jgi:succinoglycan biosynthesis transport protein ExoP